MSNPVYEYTLRTIDTGSFTIDYVLGDEVTQVENWGEYNLYLSGSHYSASIVCPALLEVELSGSTSPSASLWTVNFS